jgi:hypothetical protein
MEARLNEQISSEWLQGHLIEAVEGQRGESRSTIAVARSASISRPEDALTPIVASQPAGPLARGTALRRLRFGYDMAILLGRQKTA